MKISSTESTLKSHCSHLASACPSNLSYFSEEAVFYQITGSSLCFISAQVTRLFSRLHPEPVSSRQSVLPPQPPAHSRRNALETLYIENIRIYDVQYITSGTSKIFDSDDDLFASSYSIFTVRCKKYKGVVY